MKNISEKRFKNIFSISLSVLIILIGVLFIYHILSIYLTGSTREQIYTKEIVLVHLQQMIFPMILIIVFIIVGEIFYKVFKKNKFDSKNNSIEFVKGYLPLIDFKNYSSSIENEINEIKKYEKRRYIGILISGIICLASIIVGLIYLCDNNNFIADDPNGSIIKMALYFIPLLLVFFSSLIGYSYYEEAIAKIELKHILKVITYNRKNNIVKEKRSSKFNLILENKINIARIIVLVTSITFIVVGLINGEHESVLKKAIMICTECIGLG